MLDVLSLTGTHCGLKWCLSVFVSINFALGSLVYETNYVTIICVCVVLVFVLWGFLIVKRSQVQCCPQPETEERIRFLFSVCMLVFLSRLSFLGVIFKEKEHAVLCCKKYRFVAELKQSKLISLRELEFFSLEKKTLQETLQQPSSTQGDLQEN